jgi:hypothetical protein
MPKKFSGQARRAVLDVEKLKTFRRYDAAADVPDATF